MGNARKHVEIFYLLDIKKKRYRVSIKTEYSWRCLYKVGILQ